MGGRIVGSPANHSLIFQLIISHHIMDEPDNNPMHHPEEQPAGSDDAPRFGRLLIGLVLAVLLIVAITFISEALYS